MIFNLTTKKRNFLPGGHGCQVLKRTLIRMEGDYSHVLGLHQRLPLPTDGDG